MNFVLNNSVAMLWLLPQSKPAGLTLAQQVLNRSQGNRAQVPALWHLDSVNAMTKSLRLGEITHAQATRNTQLSAVARQAGVPVLS